MSEKRTDNVKKRPRSCSPARLLAERIKKTKRHILFGGNGRSSDRCPTCKYATTKPMFKKAYDGTVVKKAPAMECGVMQGLSFAVFENTYCKNHEPNN